jgi:hypothetical protein
VVATIPWTIEARDRIHNLDLNFSKHQKIYRNIAKEFIIRNEIHYTASGLPIFNAKIRKGDLDNAKEPNFTIGIGFNMNRSEAKDEWTQVFAGELDFEKAKQGKYSLTDDQIIRLFEYGLEIRLKELKKIYKGYWDKFKPNEKLMIEDAYFNYPKLVGNHSNFAKNVKLYVDTNDIAHLRAAVYEIAQHSNPRADIGIGKRRDAQAEMISSHKAPLYCKPNELSIPSKPEMKAYLSKTIIPRDPYKEAFNHYLRTGQEPRYQLSETSKRGDLYIWRSLHDNKVRPEHKANDGKLFSASNPPSTGNPGDDYGCRCFADYEIPIWVEVVF